MKARRPDETSDKSVMGQKPQGLDVFYPSDNLVRNTDSN